MGQKQWANTAVKLVDDEWQDEVGVLSRSTVLLYRDTAAQQAADRLNRTEVVIEE